MKKARREARRAFIDGVSVSRGRPRGCDDYGRASYGRRLTARGKVRTQAPEPCPLRVAPS
jgi:hypothetical protein